MEQMKCPGCGAMVRPTTRSLDGTGNRTQQIIPGHNPLPNNEKKVGPMETCPGSGTPVGAPSMKKAV